MSRQGRSRQEYLDAGFTSTQITKAKAYRRTIESANARQSLEDKALEDAETRPFNRNDLRGLYFILLNLFPKAGKDAIADAIDPSWQLTPHSDELQDDSSFDEIVGHLSLLRFSYECWNKVFSVDRQTESQFWLFSEPFAHNTADEKNVWGEEDDMRSFETLSTFTDKPAENDNGPSTDRLGLFVTKTKGSVKDKNWHRTPFHGWVAWLSERGQGLSTRHFRSGIR
ncbi:uncharacterized protein LY89DRAFT_410620 [Mollisia scopiformis]|uniref:Uncharacterized protein n=1 Tax=Mollisia scopiformis TaxID=149040 RepID=A0A132B289_MOLSC|nr:uncharacterized protein LY89DRAFT_410620 [Mollisia scopiformis]KUJ06515.1 hypothetical protein LY89DRAFT_410620 [Mollisia scopiformis]